MTEEKRPKYPGLRWKLRDCPTCGGEDGCKDCKGTGQRLLPVFRAGSSWCTILPNHPEWDEIVEKLNRKDMAKVLAGFQR